ncbi:hypothetical protein ERJ75_001363800 [Trypanosoma vivax]|nr:hypothetical protein ERJ75_001363800 [Trypanosoma vivax]
MSAGPQVPSSADGQELRRLLKENRDLREANATLRVALESKVLADRPIKAPAPALDRHAAAGGNPLCDTSSKAEAVKKLREQLRQSREEAERCEGERQRIEEDYRRLRDIFESFVVDVCEREEGYKAVFAAVHEEMEANKKMCESLQRQLEERSSAPTVPAAARPPAAEDTYVKSIVSNIKKALVELENRIGHCVFYDADRISNTSQISHNKKHIDPCDDSIPLDCVVDDSCGRSHRANVRSLKLADVQKCKSSLVRPQPSDDGFEKSVNVLSPAPGASKLRCEVPLSSNSRTMKSKKRSREISDNAKVKIRPPVDLCTTCNTESMFSCFTPPAQHSKGSVVKFGSDPISDYFGLLPDTDAKRLDVLHRELFNFCGADVYTLASYVVDHFLKNSIHSLPMLTLWKRTEQVLRIHENIFPAFILQASRSLVSLLGPSTIDVSIHDHVPQLRCLALVVRMACVLQFRYSSTGMEALFSVFYECTISALRRWRLSNSSRDERGLLFPWMVTVRHLCGFVEEFYMVVRYHANSEHVLESLALPKSISRYAVQAVMSSCFFTSFPQTSSGVHAVDVKEWAVFCEAMDWSCCELPCDRIGVAAVRILTHVSDVYRRSEAILTLRLLVLLKGLGFLQTLTESLRVASGEVDVDAAFAELFSLAVVDLQLEDPRDEQWPRAMSFFNEYMNNCLVAHPSSVAELVSACKETHLLVLRAMLQLCHGAGALADDGIDHVVQVLRWTRMLNVALKRSIVCSNGASAAGNDSGSSHTFSQSSAAVTHPLRRTLLGREILYLCQQEL